MEGYKMKKGKNKIVMFLASPFSPHVRVLQESISLIKAKYRVYLIAWDREGKYSTHFNYKGIDIIHIKVLTQYGSGIKQIPGLLKFWMKAFFIALDTNPEIYHANDFYTLPLAFFVNILKGKKLIYDSHENFPEFLKKGNPLWISKIVEIMERFFLKRTDYTITGSDSLRKKIESLGIKNVETIGNWKSKKIINIDMKEVVKLKKRFNINKRDFVIIYVGGLTRDRNIVSLIKAVEGKKSIKVIIFGRGESQSIIESLCNKNNNTFYGGWIPLEDVPLCYHLADVIFYALKQDSPLSNFNAPNSLGFSLIFGKPIIAYGKGDLKNIIEETKSGIVLRNLNKNTILNALFKIKTNYKYYSKNAKEAGNIKYNWENVEKDFVRIYREYLR